MTSTLNVSDEGINTSGWTMSSNILQANTETLQRYAELMGMFYIENARWLQNIYDSCYQLGLARKEYLLEVYKHVWLKFATQVDSMDLALLHTSEDKLSSMVMTLIQVLKNNPKISKEECINLCEIEFTKNKLSPEEIKISKEIISNVFDRFPN